MNKVVHSTLLAFFWLFANPVPLLYYHTDVLSKVTVCSHSCRMGGLHSMWQPGEVTLTVLESCSPQEPWWTWLTR